jgi:23S rRNA pseudouridine2605 synthase
MSKGQNQHARRPASRETSRETSQSGNPTGSGTPGGATFIKSKVARAPAGHGKKPFAKQRTAPNGKPGQPGSAPRGRSEGREEQRAPFSREGRGQPGSAPRGRSEGREEQRAPFSREGRGQPGSAPRGRSEGREEQRAPFSREGRGQPGSAPRGRSEGREDQRAPFSREGRGQPGSAPRGRTDGRPAAGPAASLRSGEKVKRAKKMALRDSNQEIMERSHRLRDTRVDFSRIEPVRLQKALAQSGVGSRREMEEWIEAGLVSVNGQKASLGDRVGPHDRVMVKGNPIKLKWSDRLPRVIIYHKQEGEIVTRDDPQGRVTIFDRLPQANNSRWVTVGRLDINTSGLLIITTSGELANRLMHPSFEVEREYAVRVLGELTDEQCREMCQDVELEDGPARFERISSQGGEGANHWYRVVIKEGRNREVRRLFAHYELQVSRLMRVRFGNISMPPRLKRGHFYELNEVEVAAVLKWSDLNLTGAARH